MGSQITEKQENVLRIYTQNINGIKTRDLKNDTYYKLNTMTDRQVDIHGWLETNLEWNDNHTYEVTKQ